MTMKKLSDTEKKKKNRSVPAAVLLTVLVIALFLILWLKGLFLPRWVRWRDRNITIHTYEPHPLYTEPGYTGTVTGEAALLLSGRRVTILENGGTVYETPGNWFISDAAAADLTGDGIEEILLLVWKRGHFGGALPFWQKRDDAGFSQHLYIFQYQDRTLQPSWMASKLPCDVQDFTITEDGTVRLVTPDGRESLWRWDFWGLKLLENGR